MHSRLCSSCKKGINIFIVRLSRDLRRVATRCLFLNQFVSVLEVYLSKVNDWECSCNCCTWNCINAFVKGVCHEHLLSNIIHFSNHNFSGLSGRDRKNTLCRKCPRICEWHLSCFSELYRKSPWSFDLCASTVSEKWSTVKWYCRMEA